MAIVPRASFPRHAVPRDDDDIFVRVMNANLVFFRATRDQALSQLPHHSSWNHHSNILLPQGRRGRDQRSLPLPHLSSYFLSRVATAAALFFAVLVLFPSPCSAGSASEGANVDQLLRQARENEVRGEQLGVPVPVIADVEVFKPRSYVELQDVLHDDGDGMRRTKKNRTAEGDVEQATRGDGGSGSPLLVFLHGFCLPDSAQQEYSFTALRANAGGGSLPRQQTLSQVGLRRGGVFLLPRRRTTFYTIF